jgi:hypothetical protein
MKNETGISSNLFQAFGKKPLRLMLKSTSSCFFDFFDLAVKIPAIYGNFYGLRVTIPF